MPIVELPGLARRLRVAIEARNCSTGDKKNNTAEMARSSAEFPNLSACLLREPKPNPTSVPDSQAHGPGPGETRISAATICSPTAHRMPEADHISLIRFGVMMRLRLGSRLQIRIRVRILASCQERSGEVRRCQDRRRLEAAAWGEIRGELALAITTGVWQRKHFFVGRSDCSAIRPPARPHPRSVFPINIHPRRHRCRHRRPHLREAQFDATRATRATRALIKRSCRRAFGNWNRIAPI
ncbi:hypothetical protein B0H17DRAFT_1032175 [Mycena rosella]|uniref:Uncharacterized protein n=1 Tax=Mycena rosella TaxID=1033263 RepID=A0AAD7MAT5_MYCRO|nr:hypothetical protein B0H17DRAFT_1032175 [Mycena rosella]